MLSTRHRRGLPGARRGVLAYVTATVVVAGTALVAVAPVEAAPICATPGGSGAGGTLTGVVNTYYPATTGSVASSHMLYREALLDPAPERFVTVPTAVAHFARETVIVPRPWAERHYHVVRWTEYDRGGHFAAVEVPDLFVDDLRGFASMLCDGTNPG